MKSIVLVVTALKVLAVFLMIKGITSLPSAIVSVFAVMSEDNSSTLFVIASSLHGIVYLVAGALLWVYAPKISKLIEADIPQFEKDENDITVSTALTAALIILGFYVLSDALPSLIRIVIAVLRPSLDSNFTKMITSIAGEQKSIIPWSDIVAMTTKIAFSVWLILGARGIVVFLKKVRYAGRDAI